MSRICKTFRGLLAENMVVRGQYLYNAFTSMAVPAFWPVGLHGWGELTESMLDDGRLLCTSEDVRPMRNGDWALRIVSQGHSWEPSGSRLLLQASRICQHQFGMRHQIEKIEIPKRLQDTNRRQLCPGLFFGLYAPT